MTSTRKASIEFRPMHGFLSMLDKLADALGMGQSEIYVGEEGLRGVAATKLKEMGVPEKPIALTGTKPDLTPRQMAEHAGFIRRRKRIRR